MVGVATLPLGRHLGGGDAAELDTLQDHRAFGCALLAVLLEAVRDVRVDTLVYLAEELLGFQHHQLVRFGGLADFQHETALPEDPVFLVHHGHGLCCKFVLWGSTFH
jgi:hypothetical protein